ncbi:DNA replication ATP-dependent helicase/nuclease DNA2-like [Nilaparvata lugens]|uniref:DNA replication ATP-dependent helicase/nuclease DNA2-like n=1 Tax=Nilaparvata lugens TaxID=108931 RepID=UPI00193DF604|nr:DNA replication ATP-dependent helicase/nuclease DNA2-like [Nilaparvata lugens]
MKKLSQKKGAKEDPKQSKISNFFAAPKNGKNVTSTGSNASTSSQVNYKVEDIEDDIKFPLTPPISQNIIQPSEAGKTVSIKSPLKKKIDKENSVEESVKENLLILSPEEIPPTPPQPLIPTSRTGNKGVKRKCEFPASKNCDKNLNDASVVHAKKIPKNVKVESSTASDSSASPSGDGNKIFRPENTCEAKDSEIEKKDSDNCKKKDVSLCLNETAETECSSDMKDLLFEDWELDGAENIRNDLNLEKAVRCTITKINYLQGLHKTEIHLKELKSSAETKCTLEGSWSGLVLRENDTISIAAKWDSHVGWVVSDLHGFVVLEPDTLISSTALVGSLFCMRRAILANMFRGLDPGSDIMVMGSLVHEILQEVLDRKVRSEDEIRTIANNSISSKSFIFSMYSSQMTMEHVKKQLDLFVPRIKTFISTYIPPVVGKKNEDDWQGEITAIEDIEENIWATNLGLKGKVDVTVKVKVDNSTKILPLELKTGRASMSSEHRGQLILYALMMTEIGQPVSSGLLLYLREGVMKEVKAGVMEKRDLLLLRNELLRYTFDGKSVDKDENGLLPSPCLPKPINHRKACNSCPYVTICSSALRSVWLI